MALPDWSDAALAAVSGSLDTWAGNNGVPRDLVYAIAGQESRYNPLATGADGEIGLMQLLPTTITALGYPGDPTDLYDPDLNAQYGTLYLAQQLSRYGTQAQAISAYNAGSAISGNAAYVMQVQARQAYFDALWGSTSGGPDLVAMGAFVAGGYLVYRILWGG